eukprot:11728526-Alexandrium_andersonii.AAC.1
MPRVAAAACPRTRTAGSCRQAFLPRRLPRARSDSRAAPGLAWGSLLVGPPGVRRKAQTEPSGPSVAGAEE